MLSGTQNYNDGGIRSTVSQNFTHPAWNTREIKNDIGLFLLTTPLSLTGTTNIINRNPAYIVGDVEVIAVGWGYTSVSNLTKPLI